LERRLYRFSSNVPFLELDCPLSGAIDIGILHSLYNQAPKKAVLYEKQYSIGLFRMQIVIHCIFPIDSSHFKGSFARAALHALS
jgi:hypothetical protein